MLGLVVARPPPERGGRYFEDASMLVFLACQGCPERSKVRPVVRGCCEAAVQRRRAGLQTAATVQHVPQFHVSPCSKRGASRARRQQPQSWLPGAPPRPPRNDAGATAGPLD